MREGVGRPASIDHAGEGAGWYQFKDESSSSHATMLRLAGRGEGRRVLDVGAADGFLAERLTSQGWRVTCIERDPALAAAARRHGCEVIVANLNAGVPSVEGRFDAMVCGDILEHLVSPEEILSSLLRVLTDDGVVIISVPNVAHLWVRIMLLLGRFDYADRGILDRTHLRFFTLKTFHRFLEGCGLDVTELVPVPAPLWLAIPPRFHGGWLHALHAVNAVGARRWPRGLAYQFVAKGRRRSAHGAPCRDH